MEPFRPPAHRMPQPGMPPPHGMPQPHHGPPRAAPLPPPPPGPPPPRRDPWWRRHHLPSMLALLVLLPVGVGVPWWLERTSMLEQGAMPPQAVLVPETSGELAGSDWEFRGAVLGETSGQDDVPDGVELVDAVFLVTPGDETASQLLASCDFRAVDGQGRSWEQTTAYSGRTLPEEVGSTSFGSTSFGCADAEGEAVAPGAAQGLVATFLVPEDAVDSLRVEVRANTSEDAEAPRPAAIAFGLDSVPLVE